MAEAAVSRILLSRLPGTAAIRLGQLLPAASSSQPVPPFPQEKGRAALQAEPIWPCTGRGLPSPPGHPDGWWALTPPFHPYPFRGGLFSVALSLGSPPVAVSDLPALWCPDFPPPRKPQRPPDSLRHNSMREPAKARAYKNLCRLHAACGVDNKLLQPSPDAGIKKPYCSPIDGVIIKRYCEDIITLFRIIPNH